MKKTILSLALLPAFFTGLSQTTDSIPSRAVILSGDETHPDHIGNVAAMYSRTNLAFEDLPPRVFFFLTRKALSPSV